MLWVIKDPGGGDGRRGVVLPQVGGPEAAFPGLPPVPASRGEPGSAWASRSGLTNTAAA